MGAGRDVGAGGGGREEPPPPPPLAAGGGGLRVLAGEVAGWLYLHSMQ